jgi:hypothetical protein
MRTRLLTKQALCATAMMVSVSLSAQTLPPIFDGVARAIQPSRVLAEFPKNTFLENLVVDADHSVYATSHEEGIVYHVDKVGVKKRFLQIDGKLAGIARTTELGFALTGSTKDGAQAMFIADRAGKVTETIRLPNAVFLNGIASLNARTYLVADSYKGTIWKIDRDTKQVTPWLQHELLARFDEKNPLPAANGIKVDATRKRVLVSNTAKQLLLDIPLNANGDAGQPKVLRDKVNVDDFVIDFDGTVFATTHVYNSLIRITPDLKVTVLAEGAQGMTGSTAVAIRRDGGGKLELVVSTNGGMFLPPPEGVQSGKIVALKL